MFDDYAHNPAKIAAAWKAVRVFANRVVGIWQPHGYGPLAHMYDELLDEFEGLWRAGDRVFVVLEDAPAFQVFHIDPVEGDEAFFCERRRRAQFAGAKCGQGTPDTGEIRLDRGEAVIDGGALAKTHPLDGVARFGRDAAGILKGPTNIAVAAGLEDRYFRHGSLL